MNSPSRTLSGPERQDRIVDFLVRHGRASIDELASALAVSAATARRDAEVLSRRGRVERVHGGVRLPQPGDAVQQERPALQREADQIAEKLRIGAAAAAMVQPGETVFVGSGTTALAAARALRGRGRLTVITNSLLVVNALADAPEIELIALGGQLRRSEMSLIGHTAERALAELRADRVLFGIRAIDAHAGLTNEWLPETRTDRAILGVAREVVVLADHTKFGRIAPAFVAPLTAAHVVVTDRAAPPEQLAAVSAAGIRVVLV